MAKRAKRTNQTEQKRQPGSDAATIAWRHFGAFAAVVIVAGCVGTGFFYYASALQVALVCGLVGGLISTSPITAAAASGSAALLASLLMPNLTSSSSVSTTALFIGAGTAAVAGLTRWGMGRGGERAARYLYWLALALIIGNLWATALTVGQMQTDRAPLFDFLELGATAGEPQADDAFYVRVKNLVAEGTGYYKAYETGVGETWGGKPGSVLAVRLPTFFWFWSRLPRAGIALVAVYLALASAAAVAATYIARLFVRVPFALVGAAAVASHSLSRAISRDITYTEPWVGAIVVICALFALRAIDEPDRRRDLVVAVILATLAALIRELGAFALAAGLVASLFLARAYRIKHITYWAAGAVTVVVAYAIHFSNATRIIDNSLGLSDWLDGSLGNLWLALTYGAGYQFIGNGLALSFIIVMMGVVGGLVASRGAARAYLATTLAIPLLFFALANNNATISATGSATNYWGLIILPTMLALAPAAFALVPGMQRQEARPSS